jgi:hypothetical protein
MGKFNSDDIILIIKSEELNKSIEERLPEKLIVSHLNLYVLATFTAARFCSPHEPNGVSSHAHNLLS